ncbi:histidine kinase dimerization/phospho-acceptor domain-containing protein, partial [Vibrio parahaemolyticus]|uniref:histidine kinase dimerization/phospho-acceptor domain-containing protein n=1 Tax=Vibrio parahaemolyticus TaxID=670 RepID=UPI00211350A2
KEGRLIDLSITSVPVVVGEEVVGVHGIAEDITERNELRRELERTQQAAEEASVAKSLFLANISHEVRRPLTSLLAATE